MNLWAPLWLNAYGNIKFNSYVNRTQINAARVLQKRDLAESRPYGKYQKIYFNKKLEWNSFVFLCYFLIHFV